MPDTRITKERLKNHLHYGKWIYVLIAVAAFFLVDLVYTMTEYRPDRYHRVDVQLVGNSIMTDEALDAVALKAVEAVKPQDPRLEEVNLYNIAYSGDASTDIYGAQKYAVMLAEGSSSIYFVNQALLEQMVAQGGALPLDGYAASGALPKADTVTLPEADSDGNPTGNRYIYAVDASGLGRMLSDDIGYDSRGKYAVIFAGCVNPDTAVAVLRNLFDQLSGPAPDSEFAGSLAAEQAAMAASGAVPGAGEPAAAASVAPSTAADATAPDEAAPAADAAPAPTSDAP